MMSAFAWSFCSTALRISEKSSAWRSLPFQEKQLPSSLPHFLTSSCTFPYFLLHISILEFVIPLCCRASGCPFFHLQEINAYNSWLLPCITTQPLQHHKASICKCQYSIRPSAMLGLGQWVEQCNLTMLGFQVLFKNIYNFFLISLSLSLVLSLALVTSV